MARRTDPARDCVRTVRERDGHVCVRCGRPDGLTTQHRVGRGMGGTRQMWVNQPANLITLCGSGTTGCHGWVEANPWEAMRLGLSVSRYADPQTVPVHTWRGLLWLRNDGTYTHDLAGSPS